ncbi:MAG: phospholipid carrier-dependent glycosyltransferase [Roseiflexaceae bacterium]|nr:phospholipid carrier-dependent glycosyltransferase [Roseiflexaceae bacterium]
MSIPDSSSTISGSSSSMPRQRLVWHELFVQWAPVLLSLFVFALFARTLSYGLYLDDNHFVRPWTLGEVLGAFAGPFDPLGIEPAYFRPLVGVTFSIEWHLWGYAPWGYHLVNILLHTLVAVLLYFLLRRMRISWWAAWFGAAFFTVIPANAATAVYIAELSDALVAIFVLCGLLSLDTYHRTGRVRWLVLLNVMFVGAVCSKEIGAAMPMLVALYWLHLCSTDQASTKGNEPTMATGLSAIFKHWSSEVQFVWQALVSRANRRNWLLVVVPLFLLAIAYVAYRGMVLPTGMLGARYNQNINPLHALLSAVLWTFKGVPYEVSDWALPTLIGVVGLALILRPLSSAWRVVRTGFLWVVAGCLPLSYLGQVEPRLLYVVQIGVGIVIAGLVTILAEAIVLARQPKPIWWRGAVGLALLSMVALLGTTFVSTIKAQNEFQPGSPKVLQADLGIWKNLKTRSRYPEHNLKIVEQHLRDANMIDANTP